MMNLTKYIIDLNYFGQKKNWIQDHQHRYLICIILET